MGQQADPGPGGRRRVLPRPDHSAFCAAAGVLGCYLVTEAVRDTIRLAPAHAWQVSNNSDRGVRAHADVVEVTGLLDLSRWRSTCAGYGSSCAVNCRTPVRPWTPSRSGTATGIRRSAPTPPVGSWRSCQARHRAHARVEDRIRTGKDTGIGHLPARHTHISAVWVELALIAADLLALAQSMLLTDQPELHRAEPKTLLYRLLHIAARIARGQRKVFLRLAEHWPWALALALARGFTWLRHIPLPA